MIGLLSGSVAALLKMESSLAAKRAVLVVIFLMEVRLYTPEIYLKKRSKILLFRDSEEIIIPNHLLIHRMPTPKDRLDLREIYDTRRAPVLHMEIILRWRLLALALRPPVDSR